MAGKYKAPPPTVSWAYDRCRVEVNTRRCYFPATLYSSQSARPDSGECRLHFGCRGSAVLSVVEESEQWWDARERGEDVPLTYIRWDGTKVPGYPGQGQLMREATRSAAEHCKQMGINTPAQARDWLRKNQLLVKRQPIIEREPGCDDE